MPHLLTAKLHAAHQDRLLARADRVADAAEKVVRGVWDQLLAIIENGIERGRWNWQGTFTSASAALRSLPQAAHIVTRDLVSTARDSARWTAVNIVEHLPAEKRAALARRHGILEAEDTDAFHAPARDPLDLATLILPALEEHQIVAVIYAAGWMDRLKALTSLAQPDVLAAQIATGIQQGQTIQEIARAIRPTVAGVQASARRVARTAGLWIAHEAELSTYDQLGDMIEGYQVNAVRDHVTRPEHRQRSGTRYYRVPKAGQLGFDKMPRPPREADGSWAFNCRCWLEPILKT